ncbi:MAG: LTA synthase family protein [Oscillospiraceae bacterium]|nr:LTA synthase family protein [Oscillospiraceae bacterium]
MRKWLSAPKVNNVFFYVLLFVTPYIVAVIPEAIRLSLANGTFYEYIFTRASMIAVSYLLFLLMHLALTAVVRRISISTGILCMLSAIIGLANWNKLLYRGDPVLPGDIFALKDALLVMRNGYTVVISKTTLLIALCSLGILLLFLPVRIPNYLQGKSRTAKCLRASAAFLGCTLLAVAYLWLVPFNESCMAALGYQKMSTRAQERRYYENTFYTQSLVTLRSILPSKPADYEKEYLAQLGNDISSCAQKEQKTPDIVVVVIESWSRIDQYDVVYDRDLFANYDRLSGEGISGTSVTALFGGGTADVEFEVLTGFTSNDTQISTTAFTLYLYDRFPGAVEYLRETGYQTYAVHAHTDELYNRRNAYPMLGFEHVYFKDSFEDPEMSGYYISDKACVEKIESLYEQAVRSEAPVMIHALTMQNHSPMIEDRYSPEETVGCTSSTYCEEDVQVMAQYGTALLHTDEAIGELADYLSNVDRDVILVVVGDHQPALGDKASDGTEYILKKYDEFSPEENFAAYHSTPYLVWSNYDRSHDGTSFGTIVPNRLLVNALAVYDVARPAYFDYIFNNFTSANGMTANYCVGTDGEVYFTKTEEQQAEYEQRQLIQYDLIFGRKYLRDYIF